MRTRSKTKAKPKPFGGAIRISNSIIVTSTRGRVVSITKLGKEKGNVQSKSN